MIPFAPVVQPSTHLPSTRALPHTSPCILPHPGTVFNDVFVCTGSFDPSKPGSVSEPPATLALKKAEAVTAAAGSKAAKGESGRRRSVASGDMPSRFTLMELLSCSRFLPVSSSAARLPCMHNQGQGCHLLAPRCLPVSPSSVPLPILLHRQGQGQGLCSGGFCRLPAPRRRRR